MPKAQSIVEYAILLGVIFAALAGMQVYSRRGINSAIKSATDQMGSQSDSLGILKFGDSKENSSTDITSSATSKKTVATDGSESWSTDSNIVATGRSETITVKEKNPHAISGSGPETSVYTGDDLPDADPSELESGTAPADPEE